MSTLNVSNITDGTTTGGTSYVVNGSAKAWVNFFGGTPISIRNSFNTSSLTDNGIGDYLTNYTNSFSATDYVCSTAAYQESRGNAMAWPNNVSSNVNRIYDDAGSTADAAVVQSAIHGDLA